MTRFDRQLAERDARRDSAFEVYHYYGALEGQNHQRAPVPFGSSGGSGSDGGDDGG